MAKAYNWLRYEIGCLARALQHPAFYGLVLGTALLVGLAYQRARPYVIEIGSDPEQDAVYIDNFHESEATTPGNEQFRFRWSRDVSTIRMPGLGRRDYQLRLRLTSGPNPAATFTVAVNGSRMSGPDGGEEIRFKPGLQEYEFQVPASLVAAGDVAIEIRVAPFTPPGDRRELGLALSRVEVVPAGLGLTLPAYAHLLWLTTAAGLVYIALVRCGFGPHGALAGGALWALGEAGFIAFNRLWLTLLGSTVVWAVLSAYLLVVLYDTLLGIVWRRFAWADERDGARRWLLALVGGAFALRLCGLLHPNIFIYDIGFHVNRLSVVSELGQYTLVVRSAEWGTRDTYYPPTMYILLSPLRFLIVDKALLIKLFAAVLDTSRVPLLYLLVRRSTGSARAALLAGFFMVALPISILPYQWGIVSNLFGEWLLTVALCLVVLAYGRLHRPAVAVALTATLFLAFLSHPGVTLLSGAVFLVLIGLLWIARVRRRQLGALAGVYVVALLLSFAVYHRRTVGDMVPQAWQMAQRVLGTGPAGAGETAQVKLPGLSCQRDSGDAPLKIQVGGSVFDTSLGLEPRCVHSWPAVLGGGLRGFVAEGWAYFRLLPLGVVPFALLWLWRGTAGPRRTGAGRHPTSEGVSLADDPAPRRMRGVEEAPPAVAPGTPDDLRGARGVAFSPRGNDEVGLPARQRLLFWCSAAWLLTATVFAVIGLVLNLYVRYSLFFAPIAAVCAGLFLARLWETGRWGKLAVWATGLYFGLAALALWYSRITFAGH